MDKPMIWPTTIRSRSDRDFVNDERVRLRMIIDSLRRQYAENGSELVANHMQELETHYDRLDALIYAYDCRWRLSTERPAYQSPLDDLERVPSELIRKRLERRYSLEQLSERCAISRNTLIRAEQTLYRRMRFETVCNIARLLNS